MRALLCCFWYSCTYSCSTNTTTLQYYYTTVVPYEYPYSYYLIQGQPAILVARIGCPTDHHISQVSRPRSVDRFRKVPLCNSSVANSIKWVPAEYRAGEIGKFDTVDLQLKNG